MYTVWYVYVAETIIALTNITPTYEDRVCKHSSMGGEGYAFPIIPHRKSPGGGGGLPTGCCLDFWVRPVGF